MFKDLWHNIPKISKECSKIRTLAEFQVIESRSAMFPNNKNDRYDGSKRTMQELFEAVCLAQFVAASVMRIFTGVDTRLKIIEQK
jgi:hypothetical protein